MTGKEVKRGQSLTKASVAPRPPTASRGGRQLSDWVAEFTGMRSPGEGVGGTLGRVAPVSLAGVVGAVAPVECDAATGVSRIRAPREASGAAAEGTRHPRDTTSNGGVFHIEITRQPVQVRSAGIVLSLEPRGKPSSRWSPRPPLGGDRLKVSSALEPRRFYNP